MGLPKQHVTQRLPVRPKLPPFGIFFNRKISGSTLCSPAYTTTHWCAYPLVLAKPSLLQLSCTTSIAGILRFENKLCMLAKKFKDPRLNTDCWYFLQGKIVFMAPTKPLVAQQIQACYKIMGIPQVFEATAQYRHDM